MVSLRGSPEGTTKQSQEKWQDADIYNLSGDCFVGLVRRGGLLAMTQKKI
jgi:hypothetical protein